MRDANIVVIIFYISLLALLLLLLYVCFLRSPFCYPYFRHSFDVSGKRSPKFEDLLDQMLIEEGFRKIEEHHKLVQDWKKDCEAIIANSFWKNHCSKCNGAKGSRRS